MTYLWLTSVKNHTTPKSKYIKYILSKNVYLLSMLLVKTLRT